MNQIYDGQTELLPSSGGPQDLAPIISPGTFKVPGAGTVSLDELGRFYPRIGGYDVILKENEHVSDATDGGDIVFKDGMITAL